MVTIKVAIISDIHGNSIALKEVLKDAKLNNVDEYIFSGDLVNDLPFGNETLEMVKSTSDKVLMNLIYCGINGNGQARSEFFREAKNVQLERSGKWYQEGAKGIYTYFKLYDDDIWLNLGKKYEKYFVF